MAIRNLRLEGDEILKKKSREVEVIDEKIQILIDDMIETMHKYNGVGLAAVQVGVLKKVIVIDLYDDNGPIVLINPVILKTKGEHEVDEGCLSFPNQFAKVVRPEEVVAGFFQRLHHVDAPVAAGVDPAVGGVALLGVLTKDALVQNGGVRGDGVAAQGGEGGDGLVSGAWLVKAV